MGKKNKLNDYVNSLYQNARIGIQTINNILPYVEDDALKSQLRSELNDYNSFDEDITLFAKRNRLKLKDNGFFEKLRLWGATKMSAIMGKTVRDYVQSLLIGTVMGLAKLYKDRWDYANLSSEADDLRNRLEIIEEDNYNALKELLQKDI